MVASSGVGEFGEEACFFLLFSVDFESNNETQRVLIYVTNTKMIEDLHHAVKRHSKRCGHPLHLEFLLGVFDGPSLPFREPGSLLQPQNNYAAVLSVAAHVDDDLRMLVDDHRPAGLHSLGTADEAAGSRSRSTVPNGSSTNLTAQPRRCRDNSEWCGSCSGGAH